MQWCHVYVFIAEVKHENTGLWPLYGATVAFHTPQRGGEQQHYEDTPNQVQQFIIITEDISVMMRKGLTMEAKSYQKEEQQSSQLSFPFDFKIQYNQFLPK